MVYRKGELSKAGVDRGWPHQVALPSSQVVAEFKTIMAFAEGLSMCVRGHWFRRDGRDYVVKCFATREDAQPRDGIGTWTPFVKATPENTTALLTPMRASAALGQLHSGGDGEEPRRASDEHDLRRYSPRPNEHLLSMFRLKMFMLLWGKMVGLTMFERC